MPQLGETVAEGTITVWHKNVGDQVASDELLFEIGTDKVEMEIPAPVGGVLKEIRIPEGETVVVGTVLAVIDDGSGTAEVAPAAVVAADPTPVRQPKPAAILPTRSSPPHYPNGKLSPAVRKLVADNNLNPDDMIGTGRNGRITRGDVLAFLKGRDAPPAPKPVPMPARPAASGDGVTVIPFDRRRKMTAEHMVRSKATSPHVLQAVEADFSKVEAVRRALGPSWREKEGFALSYLPFIAKASCEAIRDFPNINGHVEGESLVIHAAVNLAIAVDLNFQGLVAPVVKEAERMAVPELARAINNVAARARADQLTADDLAGATYTISNNGSFGTVITAPIINQPQIAILSTDAIQKKPVVVDVDGEDMIAIRPIGMLAQSFDHRAIDGAYSAAFLKRLKEILETRDWRAAF